MIVLNGYSTEIAKVIIRGRFCDRRLHVMTCNFRNVMNTAKFEYFRTMSSEPKCTGKININPNLVRKYIENIT